MSRPHLGGDPEVHNAIQDWFHKLQDSPGLRADLRRCDTLDEVYFCQGYWDLRNAIRNARNHGLNDSQGEGIAALAGVLAICREWHFGDESMGHAFAKPNNGSGLSALRFRRLLTHKHLGDLFTPLRRAIRAIKYQFPGKALAASLFYWKEPMRKQWAMDYYNHLNESKN